MNYYNWAGSHGEVMDLIEVVANKQMHKVGDEVTREITKEVGVGE